MSISPYSLNAPGISHDPDWFRKAVFYEVLVRAFSDANGDGSGDFSGLIDKLDYLQWLGVDCLWLLPFYQSPCGPFGSVRDDWNHGCASLVWFMTRSAMTRIPRRCASSTRATASARSPYSGRMLTKSEMS